MSDDLLPVPVTPQPVPTFGIVITAQRRHGDLWAAARAAGSQKLLAARLGVTPHDLCNWLNLRRCPGDRMGAEKRRHLETALFQVTGKLWDELWPAELRAAVKKGDFLQQLAVRQEVALNQLGQNFRERSLLPSPADVAERHEALASIRGLLQFLTPREQEVVRLRFGLDGGTEYKLEDCARILKITRERVRQLEFVALCKLRNKCDELKLEPELMGPVVDLLYRTKAAAE